MGHAVAEICGREEEETTIMSIVLREFSMRSFVFLQSCVCLQGISYL